METATNTSHEIIWTERAEECRKEDKYGVNSALALCVTLSAVFSAAPALVALACNYLM